MLWLWGFIRKQLLYGYFCFDVCLEWTKVTLIFTLLTVTFSHRSLTDTSAIMMAHSFPSVLSERMILILMVVLVLVYEVHSQGYILPFTFHSSHSFTRYAPTLMFWMMLIIIFVYDWSEILPVLNFGTILYQKVIW